MARLGLETQGRLGTANGLPGRDRGTGTVLPTVDLRRGDAYFHTGHDCLLVYTGTVWRQATIPRSDAATTPLYDGMLRDHPLAGLQRGAAGAWAASSPAVFALLVGGGTNTSIPTAAWTAVNMHAEEVDSHNGHDNVTNPSRWTCPAGLGGWYQAHMSYRVDTGTGVRRGGIRKNGDSGGADLMRSQTHTHIPASVAVVDGSLPALLQLNAGDYIEAVIYQDSGSTLTSNHFYASLSLHRVAV